MAAPAYKWEFVNDLFGDRIPKVVPMPAAANLETKVGTLVRLSSGQVVAAGASAASILGLAMEATDAAASAEDPIKVALLAPGMVIRGTADADASALAQFVGKTIDLNADGSLDVADTTNGCLSVFRTNNAAGTQVDCVVTEFDIAGVN